MAKLDDVLAVILGGGQGKRLYPLTKERAKPAVPIAGKYRLIDIPISNCINSGIFKISVLTQFLSVSLHRHITRTYSFAQFSRRMGADLGCGTNSRKYRLVPGSTLMRCASRYRNPHHSVEVRLDFGRRPSIPHGLFQISRIPRCQ